MFPLGTVLLPHGMLALHVFEPRYHAMLGDVLAGDREFGVVLIARGHEVGGGDERSDVGSLATVARAEELEGGRWLVVALGAAPVRVRRWLPDDPYPRAVVTEVPDDDHLPASRVRAVLAEPLHRVLDLQARLDPTGAPSGFELGADDAVVCWQAAAAAPLTPLDAQAVLEADGCAQRVALLEELLEGTEEALRFRAGDG